MTVGRGLRTAHLEAGGRGSVGWGLRTAHLEAGGGGPVVGGLRTAHLEAGGGESVDEGLRTVPLEAGGGGSVRLCRRGAADCAPRGGWRWVYRRGAVDRASRSGRQRVGWRRAEDCASRGGRRRVCRPVDTDGASRRRRRRACWRGPADRAPRGGRRRACWRKAADRASRGGRRRVCWRGAADCASRSRRRRVCWRGAADRASRGGRRMVCWRGAADCASRVGKALLAVNRTHPSHPMAVDGPKPIALRPEEAALVQLFVLLENLLLAGLILRVIRNQLSEYYRKPLESKFSKAAATKKARKLTRYPPDSLTLDPASKPDLQVPGPVPFSELSASPPAHESVPQARTYAAGPGMARNAARWPKLPTSLSQIDADPTETERIEVPSVKAREQKRIAAPPRPGSALYPLVRMGLLLCLVQTVEANLHRHRAQAAATTCTMHCRKSNPRAFRTGRRTCRRSRVSRGT